MIPRYIFNNYFNFFFFSGPSGCGKTTLLKCIVGKLKVDSGLVHVFGEPPGPKSKSGVPGRRVGYMPQELALFDEFSITETLIYFARLYGKYIYLFSRDSGNSN